MGKRIFLLILTNIGIVLTISIITSLLGLNRYATAHGINYTSLMLFCLVWGFAGAFISLAISRWMAKMMMGITPIDPANCTAQEKDLYQRISNLAYRAGLPAVPEVGLYDSPELNAFATGPTKSRSLVAVSTGLLQAMSTQEVEGVLAHEISHIANGDMVTMTLIQGVVNAFVMFFARVLASIVSQVFRSNNEENSAGSAVANFVLVMVFELIFGLIGMIIVTWFSRMREYRADEGGARLAGKSSMVSALAALQRVTESPAQAQGASSTPASLSAYKISNPMKIAQLFSTHPPLEDRIRALQENSSLL